MRECGVDRLDLSTTNSRISLHSSFLALGGATESSGSREKGCSVVSSLPWRVLHPGCRLHCSSLWWTGSAGSGVRDVGDEEERGRTGFGEPSDEEVDEGDDDDGG